MEPKETRAEQRRQEAAKSAVKGVKAGTRKTRTFNTKRTKAARKRKKPLVTKEKKAMRMRNSGCGSHEPESHQTILRAENAYTVNRKAQATRLVPRRTRIGGSKWPEEKEPSNVRHVKSKISPQGRGSEREATHASRSGKHRRAGTPQLEVGAHEQTKLQPDVLQHSTQRTKTL